jgi:hypothetical protein
MVEVSEPWWKGPYKHWKAIAAFVVTFLAQIVYEPEVTWRVVVIAFITAVAVWGVPNPLRENPYGSA